MLFSEKHKPINGNPQGILILKKAKIQGHHDVEPQESKIPEFKPLKPDVPSPTFQNLMSSVLTSSSAQSSSKYHEIKSQDDLQTDHTLYGPTDLDKSPIKTILSERKPKIVEAFPVTEQPIKYLEYFKKLADNNNFEVDLKDKVPSSASALSTDSSFMQESSSPDINWSLYPQLQLNDQILPSGINVNDLPSIDSFEPYPGELPAEYLEETLKTSPIEYTFQNKFPDRPKFLYNSLRDNLQDPRSFHKNEFQTSMALQNSNRPTVKTQLNSGLGSSKIKTKRAPNRNFGSGFRNTPDFHITKSITYQLGPKGPVIL